MATEIASCIFAAVLPVAEFTTDSLRARRLHCRRGHWTGRMWSIAWVNISIVRITAVVSILVHAVGSKRRLTWSIVVGVKMFLALAILVQGDGHLNLRLGLPGSCWENIVVAIGRQFHPLVVSRRIDE